MSMLRLVVSSLLLGGLIFSANGSEGTNDSDGSVKLDVEGWSVTIDKEMSENEKEKSKAITAVANHLQRIKYIVPENRVTELQRLPLRLDLHYQPLKNMQYHPSPNWLKNNGHDPALAKHVHIPRAAHLTDPSQWAKHPYVILHELAHAYHDQILGYNHPEILATYQSAKESKIYEEVLSHTGQKVQHYGLNNHKEYFAEMTEAYFGVNDFYPFVRAELKQHDPKMFSLLTKIWGEIE